MSIKNLFVVGLISVSSSIFLFQTISIAKTAKEIRDIASIITVEIREKTNKGSGVILDRSGNTYTVLTSAHVLKQNDGYRITTSDRRTYQIIGGSIRRFEQNIDLAVFKFQVLVNSFYSTASELGIGDCYLLREGMTIYVGGFPVNSKNTDLAFYPGEVSSNSFKNFKNGYSLVYSNDTFPGMSGGPVLNTDGQLVAIHGRGDKDEKNNDLSKNEQKTGFNLAIPINIFISIASKLGVSIDSKLYPTTTRSNNALTANEYMGIGMQKYSSGDYRGAMADFNRAIVLNPNNAENYIFRGMIRCAVVGEKAGGIVDLERAAQIFKSQKKDLEYRSTIDLIKLYRDRPERKQLNFGIPIKYFVAIASNLGVNLPSRVESLSRIEADLTAAGKINAGMKRYQLSDWQGALTEFNDAVKIDPNYAQAYYFRGSVQENLENWQGAIADYREAARIYQKQGKNNEYLMVIDRLKNIQNR